MRECSSHTICHESCVPCHVSSVMCHVSRVTSHLSHLYILFFILFLNVKNFYLYILKKKSWTSVGASQWRVCYQRGLPRLVCSNFKKVCPICWIVCPTFCELCPTCCELCPICSELKLPFVQKICFV